jgi:hypothetical protein
MNEQNRADAPIARCEFGCDKLVRGQSRVLVTFIVFTFQGSGLAKCSVQGSHAKKLLPTVFSPQMSMVVEVRDG